jgi:hypothetical protein
MFAITDLGGTVHHNSRPRINWLVATIIAGGVTVPITARSQQEPTAAAAHVDVPTLTARPEDVGSLDGIVSAYYAVITGPPGEPRQWGRDRTLYWPGIRFFSAGAKKDGTPEVQVMTHQQYVDATNASFVKTGFDEHEIHRTTQRIGNIVHIMSTYETRHIPSGPLLARGVNSLDLFWDGKRWWIISASWDDERPGSPIPPEMLP